MATFPITIDVPEHLLTVLQQRAASKSRTVQQELVESLATKLTDDEVAASHIERALAGLEHYSDAELWDTAVSSVRSLESAERSEELNDKRRGPGLTPAERVELESLVTQFNWQMLLRSKAMAILKQRGHDIQPLLALREPPP